MTTRKHLLGYINKFDTATLTASSELSTMPAQNLQSPELATPWRSAVGTTSVYFVEDCGAAVSLQIFGLLASNITAAGTWRIRGATSEADLTAAPGYDSGSISAWPAGASVTIRGNVNSWHVPTAAQSYRWWRIDLADSAALVDSLSCLEAGRIWGSSALALSKNFQYGRELGVADPSGKFTTQGGNLYVNATPGARVGVYPWLLVTEAEHAACLDVDLVVGAHGDVVYIPRPAQTEQYYREVLFGPRDRVPNFTEKGLNCWVGQVTFTERDPDARAGN